MKQGTTYKNIWIWLHLFALSSIPKPVFAYRFNCNDECKQLTRELFDNSPTNLIFSVFGLITVFVIIISIIARRFPEKKKVCNCTQGIGVVFIGAAGIIIWAILFTGVSDF